jgi:hypothetical protein
MGKLEHLQFLVLMIPTFLVLAAAAVSMADLTFPAAGSPAQAMQAGSDCEGGGEPPGFRSRCARD